MSAKPPDPLSQGHARAARHPSDALQARRLCKAIDIIQGGISNGGLQSLEVAGAMGLSQRQLERAFEAGGTTIAEEVRRARVRRAKDLLAQRGAHAKSVTEIAFACGFESLATFSRVFKLTAGVTPSEWRMSASDEQRERRPVGRTGKRTRHGCP